MKWLLQANNGTELRKGSSTPPYNSPETNFSELSNLTSNDCLAALILLLAGVNIMNLLPFTMIEDTVQPARVAGRPYPQ